MLKKVSGSYFNPEHVVSVTPMSNNHTRIVTVTGGYHTVVLSAEEVVKALQGEEN